MELKKLVPWNWLKKESEHSGQTIPTKREQSSNYRHSALNPLQTLHDEVDRIFDSMFKGLPHIESGKSLFGGISGDILKPNLDLGATENEYSISVEIPGVHEKDVKLEIVNNTLTIQGEKNLEKEEQNKEFYRLERSYGTFQRVLSLPEDADQESINASFKKGILKITIPRKELPESDVKRIEINEA